MKNFQQQQKRTDCGCACFRVCVCVDEVRCEAARRDGRRHVLAEHVVVEVGPLLVLVAGARVVDLGIIVVVVHVGDGSCRWTARRITAEHVHAVQMIGDLGHVVAHAHDHGDRVADEHLAVRRVQAHVALVRAELRRRTYVNGYVDVLARLALIHSRQSTRALHRFAGRRATSTIRQVEVVAVDQLQVAVNGPAIAT